MLHDQFDAPTEESGQGSKSGRTTDTSDQLLFFRDVRRRPLGGLSSSLKKQEAGARWPISAASTKFQKLCFTNGKPNTASVHPTSLGWRAVQYQSRPPDPSRERSFCRQT